MSNLHLGFSCARCDQHSHQHTKIVRRPDREHAAIALPPGWFFAHTPKGVGHVYLCSEECASWYLEVVCCPKACLETEECDHEVGEEEAEGIVENIKANIEIQALHHCLNDFGTQVSLEECASLLREHETTAAVFAHFKLKLSCPNRDWCEEHQVCHACDRAKENQPIEASVFAPHETLWISFDPMFGKRAVLNEVYTEDPGKWALKYRLEHGADSKIVSAQEKNAFNTRTAPESPCTCAEIQRKDSLRHFRECPLREDLPEGHPQAEKSIPMLLFCPVCHARHLDEGEFATKPHRYHACQSCGNLWRPALVNTVGVQFLPGFKNEEET